ncbi:MAG: hypothetical protein COY75_07515 [Nitrospirae bacterium CG_4_10_14_0_8_um_filter_41_23]|nr:MAG: hypothetical protein AUK38_00965 [Nitrospirae bacterium CG2_30_41_42]PIQ94604.1 MAG: hypothetical protein COV68_03880 [Nitrospirae bacterium CG11_big_fil_rev_8_21_14_0_20_41_14]PIV41283.1 MAG: hypothetical protein COS27_10000 [Nitrospirae bacterium CG02_land_8_20_14_3_00_41_53]PIW87670.1 MAG: hypothetical protein COZ94_03690 [Nitrospirae bacterium CG_4_8_14_3_um_filter_41_47]PIY86570.1 MAG: hypothetical protein COY75_07515 [Nitrospirae bacterium CG_4_10_14_0_8_um_filter_41_23]PJA80538.
MKKDMTKKYYYALFDDQIGQIASMGFNQASKAVVRERLINFLLLGNFSEEGEDSIKRNTLSELLNYYGFKLLKSDTPFKV